jgi:2-isopropylmalate synthase
MSGIVNFEVQINAIENLSRYFAVTDRETIFEEQEAPQASRELAELKSSPDYVAPFEIIRRRVIDDNYEGRMTCDATLVIRIGDTEDTEAARGVGVVHALDVALRKALLKYYPFLADVKVTETYAHATGESTEADVIAVNKFSDGRLAWTTLAKSANTIEARWQSLLDGYEWRIVREHLRLQRMSRIPPNKR